MKGNDPVRHLDFTSMKFQMHIPDRGIILLGLLFFVRNEEFSALNKTQ
jgi:hypothetical protein